MLTSANLKMKLVVFIVAAALFPLILASGAEKCELDLVFGIDNSTALTNEQFERTKMFIVELYKIFARPEHSMKFGLVSFGENSAHILTNLTIAESSNIAPRIGGLSQRGTRPSLMKALQTMQQTVYKVESGDRESAPNVAVIFIAGEPSNVIGCLKQANALRNAGVKIFPIALVPRDNDDETQGGQHAAPSNKMRDFINFLGTVAGSQDGVHILNPNTPKFLDRVPAIAGAICSAAIVKPVNVPEPKPEEAVTEKPTEAQPEVIEQKHRGPVSDYKPAAAELLDEIVEDDDTPISRVPRSTTTPRPALPQPPPQPKREPPRPKPAVEPAKPKVVELTPKKVEPPPRPFYYSNQQEPLVDMPFMPLHIVPRAHRTTTIPTTASTTTLSASDLKAIEFCQGILSHNEDVQADQFFGNPDDCRTFYQCSLETGVLTAKLFHCQPGMFWKEQLKQCMPGVACKDRCEEPSIAKRGVWADPSNCRRWFQCANSISYPACCPAGTAYDDVLMTCVTTENCHDECDSGAPETSEEKEGPTTVEPRYDANGCHDRWGGLKRPNRRNPTKYFVHIGKGNFVPLNCPLGTRFDLAECDCHSGDGEDENFMQDLPPQEIEPEEIHAWLYFPFDENLNDYSKHRLWVTPVVFGGAWVDQRIRVYGEGSARISSSGIACPGLSGADFRDHLTVSMWIKCYSASTVCYGDLFANGNSKALPTVLIALREIESQKDRKELSNNKQIAIELSIQVASADEPVSLVYPLPRQAALASWTHLGMRYDGYALSLFVNGTLITEVSATGNIGVTMTQIVIAGAVVNSHQFRGYVDEVIVLPIALDDVGMKGLLKADMARLAHDGWIKV